MSQGTSVHIKDSTLEKILKRNTDSWRVILLRKELKELEREKYHLERKSLERALNIWEIERSIELLDEIMALLSEFGKAIPIVSQVTNK